MRIEFESGGVVEITSPETIISPTSLSTAKVGDEFNPDEREDWESDRAWVFATPGALLIHNNRVERIKTVG